MKKLQITNENIEAWLKELSLLSMEELHKRFIQKTRGKKICPGENYCRTCPVACDFMKTFEFYQDKHDIAVSIIFVSIYIFNSKSRLEYRVPPLVKELIANFDNFVDQEPTPYKEVFENYYKP